LGDKGVHDSIILQEVLGRTNRLISFETARAAQKTKQKNGGGDTHTARLSHNPSFNFQNKESRLQVVLEEIGYRNMD
jgi:hypothetical protein